MCVLFGPLTYILYGHSGHFNLFVYPLVFDYTAVIRHYVSHILITGPSMAKLVALNNHVHKTLAVMPDKVDEHGADLHMIPVVLDEFLKLVVQFPILFSKNVETGQFVCVALMGLEEEENLFWQGAQFNSIYIPLNIARQPFFVGQDQQIGDDFVLCIDVESRSISESSSIAEQQRLFDEMGNPSTYLQSMQSMLAQLIEGEKQTKEFIQELLMQELLVPLSLDITFEDGHKSLIKGLYSVDEDKLAELESAVLIDLHNRGWLQAIHTQLASLGQIYALIDRRNKRQAEANPWFKSSGE
jgi:hypothetical protein